MEEINWEEILEIQTKAIESLNSLCDTTKTVGANLIPKMRLLQESPDIIGTGKFLMANVINTSYDLVVLTTKLQACMSSYFASTNQLCIMAENGSLYKREE